MPATGRKRKRVEFGPFEFDPVALELTRRGRRQRLRPQSADVLALLIEHAGEVVSRDLIKRRLWGEDTTYLDHETAINSCVRRLRAVLGDRASRPTFILTLPGKGYRFVAPVTIETSDGVNEDASADVESAIPVVPSVESAGTDVPPKAGEDGSSVANGPTAGVSTAGVRWLRSAWMGLAALVVLALAVGLVASGLIGSPSIDAGSEAVDGPSSPSESTARLRSGRVSASRLAPMPVVLATDFARSELDAQLGQALVDAFRIGVEQTQQVRLVPRRQVRQALLRMRRDVNTALDRETAIEVAVREGVAAVVLLRVVRLGAVFSVEMEAVDAGSDTTLAASRASAADQGALLLALDGLVTRLGEDLELAPRPRSKVLPLAQVTTADLDALKAYSLALERREEGNLEAAIALLGRAVEVDPEFAMAHAYLGIAYRNSGRSGLAIEHFEKAEARSERLTEYEKLYVRGWLATLRLETDAAIEAWVLVRHLYPDRLTGHVNHALSLSSFRIDFAGCRRVIAEAQPQVEGAAEQEALRGIDAYCALGLGQTDAALESVETLEQPGFAVLFVPGVLLANRRYEALETRMAAWRDGELWDAGRLHGWRAVGLADEGREQDASDAARRAWMSYRSGQKVDRYYASRIASLAYLEGAQSTQVLRDTVAAQADEMRALLGREALTEPAASVPLVALFSRVAARSGATDLARELLREVVALPGADGNQGGFWRAHLALAEAEILAAEGRPHAAVARLAPMVADATTAPFHARDSLAQWLDILGRSDAARAHDRWLVAHRGRAFAECLGVVSCFDRPFNVLAWGRAQRRLQQLDAAAQ